MALTYLQSGTLRTNQPFQNRVATASLHWATYKLGGNIDATSPQARREFAYAQAIFQQPGIKAAELQPVVVQDGAVQAAGIDAVTGDSTIDDASLQAAVEGAISKVV